MSQAEIQAAQARQFQLLAHLPAPHHDVVTTAIMMKHEDNRACMRGVERGCCASSSARAHPALMDVAPTSVYLPPAPPRPATAAAADVPIGEVITVAAAFINNGDAPINSACALCARAAV